MQQLSTSKTKAVLISSIGGGLENYDFILYVFFAPIFAQLFFPVKNNFLSLLNALAIFAIGYLARPIGGIVFGHYGDKFGRKRGMLISITIMAIATVAIGCLPTYATIGVAAPILLVIFRILQGFAIGGDLPGAISFVAEYSDNHKRGLSCSTVFFAVNVGLLLSSAVAALTTSLLTHEHLISWGWRIGFFLGLIIAVVGFYLRSKIAETAYFKTLEQNEDILKNPVRHLFRIHYSEVMQGVGLVWLFAVLIAQVFLYMPTFLDTEAHVHLNTALILNSYNVVIFALFIPIMGYLSDKVGRKPIIFSSAFLILLASYPLYTLLTHASLIMKIVGLNCFGILAAGIVGTVPTTLAELFPTHVRYSGIAISYNIGFAIFAGSAPVVATYLIYKLHFAEAPSFNIIVAAIMALIAAVKMKEGSGKTLLHHVVK